MKVQELKNVIDSLGYEVSDDYRVIGVDGTFFNINLVTEDDDVQSFSIVGVIEPEDEIISLYGEFGETKDALDVAKGINLLINSYESLGTAYDFLSVKAISEGGGLQFLVSGIFEIYDGVVGKKQLQNFFERLAKGVKFFEEKINDWKEQEFQILLDCFDIANKKTNDIN